MVARWYQTCRGTWTLRVRNPPVVIVNSSWRIIQKHRRNGSMGCGGICDGGPRGMLKPPSGSSDETKSKRLLPLTKVVLVAAELLLNCEKLL